MTLLSLADVDPLETKAEYDKVGAAIAKSSNPNTIYGVWPGGMGKSWKWAAAAGGHYWRTAADIKNVGSAEPSVILSGTVLTDCFDAELAIGVAQF